MPERTKPVMRPYLAATGNFASGKESPRAFLERCLDALDYVGAEDRRFRSHQSDGARAAADASTVRWRDGRPLSPIDGMPIGIKDIIETADMPTEMGSPLFDGLALGTRCGDVVRRCARRVR